MSDIEQYCPEYTIAETRLETLGYSPSTRQMVLEWSSVLGREYYQAIIDMSTDDLATMVKEIPALEMLRRSHND